MRSRVIPETDRPLSRLQLVRTVHLANRQDGIYPLPRPAGQNVVAKLAGFKTSLFVMNFLDMSLQMSILRKRFTTISTFVIFVAFMNCIDVCLQIP